MVPLFLWQWMESLTFEEKGVDMWVPIEKMTDRKDLVGHLVLSSLAKALDQNAEKIRDAKGCEAILTVNGKEVDLQGYADRWEAEIDMAVRKEAKKLAQDKLNSLQHLIDGVEEKMKELDWYPSDEWY